MFTFESDLKIPVEKHLESFESLKAVRQLHTLTISYVFQVKMPAFSFLFIKSFIMNTSRCLKIIIYKFHTYIPYIPAKRADMELITANAL